MGSVIHIVYKTNILHIQIHIHGISPLLHVLVADRHHQEGKGHCQYKVLRMTCHEGTDHQGATPIFTA
jgi:hypothetical protein